MALSEGKIVQIIGPVIVMNIYYSKVIGLDIKGYFKSTVPILLKISCVLAGGMVLNYFWNAQGWLILGVQVLMYLLVYLAVIYFWAFNDYEKSMISGIVKKFIK